MSTSSFDDLLEQIDVAQDAGDWARVSGLAEQALQLDPTSSEARSYQTIAARRLQPVPHGRAAVLPPTTPVRDGEGVASPAPERPSAGGPLPMVGRKRELATLAQLLEPGSGGRVVLISGGPGVGKTRLAEEFGRSATRRGATVVWGRCQPDSGAPPYFPWMRAMRALADEKHPDLAAAVDEMRSPASGSESMAPASASARFALYDRVAAALEVAAQEAGWLVLILDDLQWADEASLGLLQFFGLQTALPPIVVVGTYRNAELGRRHPLTHTLGELRRQDRVVRLRIGTLTEAEVAEIVATVAGATPPGALVDAVHHQTDGNALFVTEVVCALVADGTLDPSTWDSVRIWDLHVPEGIREAIGSRLDDLPEPAVAALNVAAVLGQEFRAYQLDAIAVDDASPPSGFLDLAVDAGLVSRHAREVGSYHFAHPLIREAVLAELGGGERAVIHADIARTLERLYRGKESRVAAALAVHFGGAISILGTAKAVRYALAAGNEALAKHAYADAKRHFERGLAALGHDDPAPPADWNGPERRGDDRYGSASEHRRRGSEGGQQPGERHGLIRADLLFGLGICQYAARDSPEAAATVAEAFYLYEGAGRRRSAVAVAAHPFVRHVDAALFQRALALAPRSSLDTGRIICNLVGSNPTNVDHDTAEVELARALEMATRQRDAALEQRVLSAWLEADFWADVLNGNDARMERLAALVEVGEDPRARAASSYSLSLILRARGELQQAAAWGGRAVQAAERLGHERLLRLTYSQMFMICHCLGEWDEALEWGQKELRYTDPVTPYIARRLALEAELGHADQVERLWERLAAPRQRPWHRSAVALTTAAVSRITGDRSRLHLVTTAAVAASVPEEGGQLTTTRRRIGAARGLLAVMRDDKQAARDILAEQERWQTVIPDAYVNLVTPRLLGLLAGTVGDRQGAITHFERAVLVCSESGARPELAWSMADYAELLLAEPAATRGVGVAPRSAGTLLQEAKALSSSLGMAPLQARLNGLSTRLADATTGPEAIGGRRLTRREREVLQLLRTGQTNKEISFALGISVKTTENHIANIFAKTGVGNRTEAAALGKKG